MSRQLHFTLSEDHIKLLRRAHVSWEDGNFGAPTIDSKRPYGNSFVEDDVAKILGWKVDDEAGPNGEQRAVAAALHQQTQAALQIVLVAGAMVAGEYRRTDPYDGRSWVRVDAPVLAGEADALPEVRKADVAYLRKEVALARSRSEEGSPDAIEYSVIAERDSRIVSVLEAVAERQRAGNG
ncbi:MAG: hypothetical protein C0497_14850 [Gemmatimonas sp.]|nr:hypothetical protein [Gemmatimonas sp.]